MEVRTTRATKADRVDSVDRLDARWEIIQAVNRFKLGFHARHLYTPKMLGIKNINEAVKIARHNMLLKNEVYVRAGFRPYHPPTINQPRVPMLIKRMRKMKHG